MSTKQENKFLCFEKKSRQKKLAIIVSFLTLFPISSVMAAAQPIQNCTKIELPELAEEVILRDDKTILISIILVVIVFVSLFLWYKKAKKRFKKSLAIIIILLTITVISWVNLTKLGLFPNYLNIGFLHPNIVINIVENGDGQKFFCEEDHSLFKKPVIYLYPKQREDVDIRLDYQGEIIAEYPERDKKTGNWNVVAYPDGRLVNKLDNKEYSYIFWEGLPRVDVNWNLSEGFVVKGEDTRNFLQTTLSRIGLTPKEYNEFIVFWYPIMKNNKYNLIHFAGEQYLKTTPMTITPHPDSVLRVFMVLKPLKEKMEIRPQFLQPFERKGFTVVEWGGTMVD